MADDFVKITSSAQKHIEEIIKQTAQEEKKLPADYKLRIYVEGGGCAGFQYGIILERQTREDDAIQKIGSIEVVIDSMSQMYIKGATVDYVNGLYGSGLKIINPNSSGSCGCGNSFST